MKKLTKKRKKANKVYGYKRFKRRLRSKIKRKNARKKGFHSKVLKHRSKKYITINAPENYSFIHNTEEFIAYLNKAKKIAHE
jgi:hypothetical protein